MGVLEGNDREDFSVHFTLSDFTDVEHFVAREQELADMHRILSGHSSRRTVVLHGLGGIGKTQLAVAYAKWHKDNYSGIFWLNIKDEDSLKQSFANMAMRILREHPSTSRLSGIDVKGNLHDVVDAVKAWLSRPDNTRWLLIYDNYDNPKLATNTDPAAVDIRIFLPESCQGSVIITTRSSQVGIGHLIQIRQLENMHDSLKILSNASRRDGLINNPDAIELAKELDGHPLALATAGAYLDQVAISLLDYLRLYKESWAKLQKTSPVLNSYEDRTLFSTWQVSFNHVENRNKLSANLLRFWAYFDSQDLWFELLQHVDSEDPDWIQELVEDELSFHHAMQVLSEYGLVEVNTSSQGLIESIGYRIHSCVHSWIVHVLNQEWDNNLARVAVKFVALHVPGEQSTRPWLTQRRLLPHAARCSFILSNGLVTIDKIAWACHNLGSLYADQGMLAEAEAMYQRALDGYEKALGAEHTSTLDTVNNFGNLFRDQGKLAEAEAMYQRALDGYEKALGAEHTSTLDTVNNLGNLYRDQGKLAEAEVMYRQALQGYEKAWGPEHTSTLLIVNNLGSIYADQSKLAEAEAMFQRALHGYEKALGAEHTSTLLTVNNLGNLYRDQGKLAKADAMYQRALQGFEKVWGPEHTTTLSTVNNLGTLYRDEGKLAEAEAMYERVLSGYEKALGAEHTSTLDTVNNLGNLFRDQGKLAEAEAMYQRALHSYEKALGAEHTSTLDIVNNLGSLYADQSKLAEAEAMFQRALHGYEKALGAEHTSTLLTVNNLGNLYRDQGNLYRDQGKLAKADAMYQRALQGFEKVWGPEHTTTLSTVNNLGNLYRDQGKLAKADAMYQRALQGFEKAWGPQHISTLSTVNNLGSLYKSQDKLAEAEEILQRAPHGHENTRSTDNATIYISAVKTIWGIGSLFKRQTNSLKSRILYPKALIEYEKAIGPDYPNSQNFGGGLHALEAVIENNALVHVSNFYEGSTLLAAEGNLSKSKGPTLLQSPKEEQVQALAQATYCRILKGCFANLWNFTLLHALFIVSTMRWVAGFGNNLPEGVKRLQWTCHCGHKSFSDYHNTSQYAIDKLLQKYTDSGTLSHIEQSFVSRGWVWEVWMLCHNFLLDSWWNLNLSAKQRQPSSIISTSGSTSTPANQGSPSLALGSSASAAALVTSGVSAAGKIYSRGSSRLPTSDIELQNVLGQRTDPVEKFLLLCVQRARGVPHLQQPNLLGIDNDHLLFEKLSQLYRQFRPAWMRSIFRVHKISLIRFELRVNDFVTNVMPDQLPTPQFAPLYEFDPAPHDHPFITKPPLDSVYAVHLFYCPKDCNESRSGQKQNVTLLQLPKRIQWPLRYSNAIDERIGFGVLIQDGFSVGALVVLFVVAATLLGLVISTVLICTGHTVGDSFTVAAWPAAIVAIVEAGWLVYIAQP